MSRLFGFLFDRGDKMTEQQRADVGILVAINKAENDIFHIGGCMVRKANELESLDELNLSKRTRAYIEKREIPLDELVLMAREATYRPERRRCKWLKELITALDKAGFIRHDLSPEQRFKTQRVMSFYRLLGVPDIRWKSLDNDIYEKFQPITEQEYEEVVATIESVLPYWQLEVFKHCSGFDGFGRMSMSQVADYCGISYDRTRRIMVQATRKLCCNRHLFPPLFGQELEPIETN